MKPRAVLYIAENGNQDYLVDGDVDFIIIDERVPRDRVYQMQDPRVDRAHIDLLIGQSRIGTLGDMPGVEAAIRADVDGDLPPRTPLKLV